MNYAEHPKAQLSSVMKHPCVKMTKGTHFLNLMRYTDIVISN